RVEHRGGGHEALGAAAVVADAPDGVALSRSDGGPGGGGDHVGARVLAGVVVAQARGEQRGDREGGDGEDEPGQHSGVRCHAALHNADPTVSVIVPAKDEARTIVAVLDRLSELPWPL